LKRAIWFLIILTFSFSACRTAPPAAPETPAVLVQPDPADSEQTEKPSGLPVEEESESVDPSETGEEPEAASPERIIRNPDAPPYRPFEYDPRQLKALDEYLLSRGLEADREEQTRAVISSMTLDEKIGQLFILAIRHTAYGKPALKMDDTVRQFMENYKPGGIILFTVNYRTPEQTRLFIRELQDTSRLPLFISTDEEGGKVSRLGKNAAMDVISLPPARDLGDLGDPAVTEQAAGILAADLRDLGFNMNMAPVADISRNRPPDVIGNRSFSSDPRLAGDMVASSVRGLQSHRVSSVLKHFPGHGNVNGDTHTGRVTAPGDLEEFHEVDFLPFRKGIEAGVDFVMTAHIQAPSLSGSSDPASLNYDIQTGILRNELGFEGLIITDAMDMGAISRYWSPGEAALKAFTAGADIILMPENIPAARDSLKKALSEGLITEERLDESLYRIISTKIRRGLFAPDYQIVERITEEEKKKNHTLIETYIK